MTEKLIVVLIIVVIFSLLCMVVALGNIIKEIRTVKKTQYNINKRIDDVHSAVLSILCGIDNINMELRPVLDEGMVSRINRSPRKSSKSDKIRERIDENTKIRRD